MVLRLAAPATEVGEGDEFELGEVRDLAVELPELGSTAEPARRCYITMWEVDASPILGSFRLPDDRAADPDRIAIVNDADEFQIL